MTSPSRPRPVLDEAASAKFVLPQVECDPLASLPPSKITVDYLGNCYTVPAMTAADWLAVLWEPDFSPDDIFPNLAAAEDDMVDAIILGEALPKDVLDVAFEVLEAASGFKWWFTLRACAVMRVSWFRIGGFVTLDPARVSLGMFLVHVLGQCVEHMEPQKAAELIDNLNEVPPGYEGPVDEFADGAAFLAAMQQL